MHYTLHNLTLWNETKEQAHRIKQLQPLGFKNKLSYFLFKY